MTAPGFAACLVFMAVSLAACQSADSGTGGQKENIAAVREQDGAAAFDVSLLHPATLASIIPAIHNAIIFFM